MECKSCKQEIISSYVHVLGDKYHPDCLKCIECGVVLQDVYFMKNSDILCQEHYSIKYSSKCSGCSQFIYQEFIMNCNDHWHVECWKLFRIWDLQTTDLNQVQLKGILDNLENYEIKTGQQISKILVEFANLQTSRVAQQTFIFLHFIETLYYSLFLMESEALKYGFVTGFTEAVKDMTLKIIEFIHILSKKDLKGIQIDKITELVYSVKLVTRLGLKDAQRIQELGSTDFLLQFIEWLQEEVMFSREKEDSLDLDGHTRCMSCLRELDEDCLGIASKKWHLSCLKCCICRDVAGDYFMNGNNVFCSRHVESNTEAVRLLKISRLEQYNYLLLYALKRFCDSGNASYPPILDEIEISKDSSIQLQQSTFNDITSANSSSESSSEEFDSSLIKELNILWADKQDVNVDETFYARNLYISDLSGYRYMIANQMAAISLHSLLSKYFSLNEIMNLVNYQKSSAWSKFLDKVRPIKIVKRYFGVPLENQIEASGCTLNVGPRYIQNIRLPLLFRDLILALFQDLSVVGIFRKNGNIKKMKIISEACNCDYSNVSLKNESPIQLAALMKKYLRELPDPLLTRKLYRAFISTQKIEPHSKRLQALNLVICLLPKTNYAILQVLVWFFEHLTTNFGIRNRMDVDNIATVIAPSLLASNSNEHSTDDLILSIAVVKSIIVHQHTLWLVPLSITNLLSRLGGNNDDIDKNSILTSEEIIREYRREIIRRNQPS